MGTALTRDEWKLLGRAVELCSDATFALPADVIPFARLALVRALNALYEDKGVSERSNLLQLLVKLSSPATEDMDEQPAPSLLTPDQSLNALGIGEGKKE